MFLLDNISVAVNGTATFICRQWPDEYPSLYFMALCMGYVYFTQYAQYISSCILKYLMCIPCYVFFVMYY